jgi:hypothetical protein
LALAVALLSVLLFAFGSVFPVALGSGFPLPLPFVLVSVLVVDVLLFLSFCAYEVVAVNTKTVAQSSMVMNFIVEKWFGTNIRNFRQRNGFL